MLRLAAIQLHSPWHHNADNQIAVPTSEAGLSNSAIQACDATEDVYECTNDSDTANRHSLISVRISVLLDRIEAARAASDKAMKARNHDMKRNTYLQARLQSCISKLVAEKDQAVRDRDTASRNLS